MYAVRLTLFPLRTRSRGRDARRATSEFRGCGPVGRVAAPIPRTRSSPCTPVHLPNRLASVPRVPPRVPPCARAVCVSIDRSFGRTVSRLAPGWPARASLHFRSLSYVVALSTGSSAQTQSRRVLCCSPAPVRILCPSRTSLDRLDWRARRAPVPPTARPRRPHPLRSACAVRARRDAIPADALKGLCRRPFTTRPTGSGQQTALSASLKASDTVGDMSFGLSARSAGRSR